VAVATSRSDCAAQRRLAVAVAVAVAAETQTTRRTDDPRGRIRVCYSSMTDRTESDVCGGRGGLRRQCAIRSFHRTVLLYDVDASGKEFVDDF